jgi:thiol:disulfide interchange protein DsbD
MIPMTVSFFLKRTKDRSQSIKDATIYGISIIVIYVGLGLLITAIFGASALNSLATNAVFNIIFFLLLVVFALSFFGAFELTLPESWTTKLDAKADAATGLLSIFFMAFTLCLVSFSCTGPIIGTLLVEAATSGSMFYPAIGMFGFALALSLPFTLFAMFPSMLKSMPSSGGWLNMVKVVLGFCELALAFKFLSVADLAYGWRILDRETFLAIWIVIFALLGMYLLGFIRLPHDDDPDPSDRVSVTRLMLALVSFSFAVYMVPGLWGAPCKAISAFTPPMSTQDFKLGEEAITTYHNYEEGMAAAQRAGKPVLVDFSGYGCVNCRKMEAAVWTAPEVKNIIENDYVLIELMVDDKAALPGGTEIVKENGKDVKLRTIGDKWSYLQRYKFGANAQPFYVLLDANGNPLTGSYSYNEDVPAYVEFLRAGLKNFKK